MDHAELTAKRLFESILVGSRMIYRLDQSRGQHDFDLHQPDGTISAVEVTSSVDQAVEQAYARILNARKGGAMVRTNLCQKDWLIHPALGADTRLIRSKIDSYLADIEADGIDRFWGPTDLRNPSVERIYRDLAVISGSVFPHWKTPGWIGISLPTHGGAFKKASAAIEAAEKEAFKNDNRKKLGVSGMNDRYLAVYVFATNYSPWCALVDCDPAPEPANLPPEITHLWLFSETRSPHEYIAWRSSTSIPWARQTLFLYHDAAIR